jgi:hypothetical protein
MATFKPSPPPKPIEIKKFLGLNESVGETEIQLGESVKQVNFRITQNYKPQKRTGYKTFINYNNSKAVQGLWEGQIGNKHVLISCNDGKVYEYNFATGTNTQIGTLTDAKTSTIYFQSKLLFFNGTDLKQYDGTTFGEVTPYEPTIYYALAPDLSNISGEKGETVNLLTGRQWFEYQGDGTTTVYKIPLQPNINVETVLCTIDGTTKTEGTDFTVDRTVPKITFNTAPANKSIVRCRARQDTAGHADLVKKNKYCMTFGPGNDTAIFLWGNPSQPNRRTWCAALNAAYWPVDYFTYIGTDEYPITDIKAVYDRQIIFKEDRTHYSIAEQITLTDGSTRYDYPVYDLNEKVGHVAPNQVQIVKNLPLSLKDHSFWYWINTSVEDERNAEVVSERIRESLANADLSAAITFDYQKEKEYWCNVGDMVYIWNYGNDTYYMYDNISATCFIDVDGGVYFGTNGSVERYGVLEDNGNPVLSDNGTAIESVMELGFSDFDTSQLRKNSRKMWIVIQPFSNTSAKVTWQTDRKALTEEKAITIDFRLLDYSDIDYADWSYETNRNPQPYRKKIRAKKYAYIKFIFKNNQADEELVILSLKVEAETTSEVK